MTRLLHRFALLVGVAASVAACTSDPISPERGSPDAPLRWVEGEQPVPPPPAYTIEEMSTSLADAESALTGAYQALYSPMSAGNVAMDPLALEGGNAPQMIVESECVQGFLFCYHVNGSAPHQYTAGAGAPPWCDAYAVVATAAAGEFVHASAKTGTLLVMKQNGAAAREFAKAVTAWTGFYIAYHEWRDCVNESNQVPHGPHLAPR